MTKGIAFSLLRFAAQLRKRSLTKWMTCGQPPRLFLLTRRSLHGPVDVDFLESPAFHRGTIPANTRRQPQNSPKHPTNTVDQNAIFACDTNGWRIAEQGPGYTKASEEQPCLTITLIEQTPCRISPITHCVRLSATLVNHLSSIIRDKIRRR